MMLFGTSTSVSLDFFICLQSKRMLWSILSTEKDYAGQCTCFIVNEYSEILAYLNLLHTLQETSLHKIALRHGEHFTLSAHKVCPGPKEK